MGSSPNKLTIGTPSRGFRALLLRAQDGDRGAMDEVLDLLRPHLEYIARPYAAAARPVASTTDLVQDACLRTWKNLGRFETRENDEETFVLFRAWAGQILRRLAVDAQRHRGRQRRKPPRSVVSIGSPITSSTSGAGHAVDPEARDLRPSANLRARELDEEFRRALGRLEDARDAAIIELHVFEGLPLRQVSERLELGYDLVRDHYWSTMERIRRDLRGWR